MGNRDDHGRRSQVATARDAGDGLAVGRQVFRSHLVQTSENLDANSEPNPVDNIQPVYQQSQHGRQCWARGLLGAD